MEKKYEHMYLHFTNALEYKAEMEENSFLMKGTLILNTMKREGEFQADDGRNIIFDIESIDTFKADGHFQIFISEADGREWIFREYSQE